jgi:2',3'-cyclic-nucleotide 2'-phosphodiesterase (5'-nucleotidase family)
VRRARILLVLTLLAGAPLPAVTLTILHTSDLHGRVDSHDALEDTDLGEGLARVAAAVAAIRAEGRPVLLLDSGDTIQGSPTQALAFAGRAGDGSDPIIRAMNRVGYDAMAVGNHEFDFGVERLERSRKEARFPWLSANTTRANGDPAFEPYVVRELAGIRVGVLGLVTPRVGDWESPSLLAGLRFSDTVEAARRYVPVLRGKERCDLVVVITHQGFERDLATGRSTGGSEENQAYALATEVPGIDLLLAGHAHVIVEPRRLGSTWVSEPGRWGNTLTRFDVTVETAGGARRVTAVVGRSLPMRGVAPDPGIEDVVENEQRATLAALGERLAVLEEPVSARDVRVRDTALLDWLHAVQLAAGRAELSFGSLLPNALPDWPAGPLTLRQVWAFYPYENSLVTVRATGRQVRQALERGADCLADPAARGRNCDTLQGADYVIDVEAPRGHRVISLTRQGRPVRDDDTFTVALNSYRASGGGGFFMWKRAAGISEGGNIRDLLAADARRRGRLRLESDGNWRIVGRR